MARPWVRWLSRIAIAIIAMAVVTAPSASGGVSGNDQGNCEGHRDEGRALPTFSIIAIVVEIAIYAALVLLAAIWWLWWRLPRRQVARLSIQIPDPKARADAEDNFRKTVGQALGGAAVLIGAGAAYLQFTQQQQASHDLLISNQASKGFEQLASDKITMRLGGLYALEGVMNTSSDYHQPVLEALCAFVRNGTVGMIVDDKEPVTDIQTALTVIGRHKPGPGGVDLTQSEHSRGRPERRPPA